MTQWQQLQDWFQAEFRDLPWRENRTPYRVWVSEIMLQQTQVSVVIPYFERWMQLFPTVSSLAEATRDEVIKAWEGLGYYSRARNLHDAAKQIVKEFNGELPCDPQLLLKIKGIGPYTVGAICSFAFGLKVAAVDGNVLRVMSRLFMISDDIAKSGTQTAMRLRLQEILPECSSGIVSEALIELGATVCKKQNPDCARCPMKSQCLAYRNRRVGEFPIKSKGAQTEKLYRAVTCVISDCGHCLVRKGHEGKIMADLYEFPFWEWQAQEPSHCEIGTHLENIVGTRPSKTVSLQPVEHSFTRFRVKIWPFLVLVRELSDFKEHHWVPLKTLSSLPFSSGHRKILAQLKGSIKGAVLELEA